MKGAIFHSEWNHKHVKLDGKIYISLLLNLPLQIVFHSLWAVEFPFLWYASGIALNWIRFDIKRFESFLLNNLLLNFLIILKVSDSYKLILSGSRAVNPIMPFYRIYYVFPLSASTLPTVSTISRVLNARMFERFAAVTFFKLIEEFSPK